LSILFFISIESFWLTVLVDEHSDADPRHVQSVQKVLNTVFRLLVHGVRLLEFEHSLSHRLNGVRMPVADHHQSLAKSANKSLNFILDNKNTAFFWVRKIKGSLLCESFVRDVVLLEVEEVLEALGVPLVDEGGRRHPQQVLGQKVDFLHYVGQTDGQLLAQEDERRPLTSILTCNQNLHN